MTTLLITGAGGFLGGHILEAALKRTDWNVVAVDSFRHNGGTDRILQAMVDSHLTGEILDDTRRRVKLWTHDLTVPPSPQQLSQIGEVDYIVHAAAMCSVDHSIAWPREHVENNIASTLTMLDTAVGLNPKRYLHVSTDEVFGSGTRVGMTDQHNPSSPYAASKAACEDLTKAWSRTYGFNATIVNSCNLFGPRQSLLAFIPKVINSIWTGYPIQLHTRPDGKVVSRWYTYAPNFAEWIIDEIVKERGFDRFGLQGQVHIGIDELTNQIAQIMGKRATGVRVPMDLERPGGDVDYPELWSQWSPSVSFDVALDLTVNWYLQNTDWLRG